MMLHPSYSELIDFENKDVAPGEEPVVRSRYSIIHAAAKRAHQIVDGATPLSDGDVKKPLSLAVKEFSEGKVHIVPAGAPSVVMGDAMSEAGLLGGEQLIGGPGEVEIDPSELVGGPSIYSDETSEAGDSAKADTETDAEAVTEVETVTNEDAEA